MVRRRRRAANHMIRLGGAAALLVAWSATGAGPAAAHSCAEQVTIAENTETDVEVGVTVGDVTTDEVAFEFPSGFEIIGSDGARGWDATADGTVVRFTGGPLEAQSCAVFAVKVRAESAGTYRVRARHHVGEGRFMEHPPNGDAFVNPDGSLVVVDHQGPPNPLFEQVVVVTPGEEGSSSARVALLILTAGAVVAACIVLLPRRRPRREAG